MERRAEELADRVLSLWPWSDPDPRPHTPPAGAWRMRWRIEGGDWHQETYASQMVLNVAGELLCHDPRNAARLRGEALSRHLQLASQYPAGSQAGTLTMYAVPGHDSYVLYPYRRDFTTSVAACREMGERCGISVDVEFQDTDMRKEFWRRLKVETGGLPGQGEEWRSWTVWTQALNEQGDMVGVSLSRESIGLHLRASRSKNPSGRALRMLKYSQTIRESMTDQQLDGNQQSESKKGKTVSIRRPWDRDDQDTWPQAAQWIKDQTDRLLAIAQANP